MSKILVVSGAFSYNGHNQSRAMLWTKAGKALYDKLGIEGIYSTYTANNDLQGELRSLLSYSGINEYFYLPCTPDGYLKNYADPFLDKIYLTKIDCKYNSKACSIEDYDNGLKSEIKEPVLKGRCSSGSKQVFFGIENWKVFKSVNDFIIQERQYGTECLFDVTTTGNGFVFTGRKNVKIVGGRDKKVRFLKADSREVELFKELLESLSNTFDLPVFFNVQCIVNDEGIHVIEIDSRFSGTVGCTTAYIPLLRKAWVKEESFERFEFIESKLNPESQDASWELEVVND